MDDSKELLKNLNEQQKDTVLKILKEFAKDGSSRTYAELLYADYKEIPVDIETFLNDDKYLGNAWKDGSGKLKLYPFWLKELKDIFPSNIATDYDTLLESGARGIGKSEIACGVICPYLMYRVMCLKDPLEHYHIKNTEKIAFAFMNIKLDLAEAIATDKFQKTIQKSPWFMNKGKMTQRNNNPYWNPPDPLELIIGSQSDDVIGRPIFFCLDGETMIKTTEGLKRLDTLVDKDIQVISIDEQGEEVISEHCTVKPTLKTNEEYQIELEDGSIIKCTPTHRFMLKNGTYKMAKDLTEDDELFDENIKPFGYIYKFVNTKTNRVYIGKREKSEFDIHYYGSGKLWKEDLKKYGKGVITREIICFGYSREELNELEKLYINLYKAQDKAFGYNIHKGGQGGNSLNDTEKWSELHKGEKNGRYHKEVSEETRKQISIGNKGKIRSDKFKRKISSILTGKKKPANFGEKVSKALKGKKKSDIHLQHLKKSHKIVEEKNRGRIIYNNGIREIRLHPNEMVPEGFIKGRIKSKMKSNLPKNYHWYNNGKIAIYCEKCPEGFVKGRKLMV